MATQYVHLNFAYLNYRFGFRGAAKRCLYDALDAARHHRDTDAIQKISTWLEHFDAEESHISNAFAELRHAFDQAYEAYHLFSIYHDLSIEKVK